MDTNCDSTQYTTLGISRVYANLVSNVAVSTRISYKNTVNGKGIVYNSFGQQFCLHQGVPQQFLHTDGTCM